MMWKVIFDSTLSQQEILMTPLVSFMNFTTEKKNEIKVMRTINEVNMI